MKTTKIIIFIITIWILWGIKENFSVISTTIQTNSLLYWLLNATSLFTYLILFGISFLLFRLISIYGKKQYFDIKSVNLVRKIAFLVLILALLDVANRSLYNYYLYPKVYPFAVIKDFIWRIIFVSPTFLFCSILIFILADFMKKAITIKNENESFI